MGCCAACDGRGAPPPIETVVSPFAADGGYVAGAGADVAQSTHARAQLPTTVFANVVGQNMHIPGARFIRADLDPVQQFRTRVETVTVNQIGSASINDAAAMLPGRYPAAGWDGEASAQSPLANLGGA